MVAQRVPSVINVLALRQKSPGTPRRVYPTACDLTRGTVQSDRAKRAAGNAETRLVGWQNRLAITVGAQPRASVSQNADYTLRFHVAEICVDKVANGFVRSNRIASGSVESAQRCLPCFLDENRKTRLGEV